MAASGGRGGRVVKVTNLNRSGEGSLAAALELEEPRIIVFDVSGVIEGELPRGEWLTNKASRIYSATAPVTIAAQTAPGAWRDHFRPVGALGRRRRRSHGQCHRQVHPGSESILPQQCRRQFPSTGEPDCVRPRFGGVGETTRTSIFPK